MSTQLEETKVIRTLADAVEAYNKKAILAAEEEEKRIARVENETARLLDKMNIAYDRIEQGNIVVFEYDGKSFKFIIWGNEQNLRVKRIATCPHCQQEMGSWEKNYVNSLAEFGELTVNPMWDHYCQLKADETATDRLVSALNELLGRNYE